MECLGTRAPTRGAWLWLSLINNTCIAFRLNDALEGLNIVGCLANITTTTSEMCYCESGGFRRSHSDRNSDVYLDSMQMIRKYNYPAENHVVVTDDGYRLNLFRIHKQGPPVLLVHGIGDSSDSWLVLGPRSSLAYRLADAGFDVWLFNSRGNRYSKNHTNIISEKEYWNFSFEEMGTKDLPATIDYILSTTFESKLSYVGFSQGTTIFLVLCSMHPSYNEKFKHAFLLAPVATINSIKIPLIPLYSRIYEKLTLLANAGVNEVFPFTSTISMYHAEVCDVKSPLKLLCELEYYFNFGLGGLDKLSGSRQPVITSHLPAGASAKTFLHFLQGYVFRSFRRYDYGHAENVKVYNSSSPPVYDLSLVNAPVTLIISESDWVSTLEDAKLLQEKLTNIRRTIVINKRLDFSHLEFIYGARVNSFVNDPITNILQNVT
ncbi:lipase 3-like [Battus philenor]|uniref:lipase 3-like n=1 Tax=Battus philenor TaxID=42288 RepID=UPI0035D0B7BC